jgi:hypothetical protein
VVEQEARGPGGLGRALGPNVARLAIGGALVLGILAVAGRGGTRTATPHAVQASGWQTRVGAPGAFIRVDWNRPRDLRGNQVLQYVVWRQDRFGTLEIVAAFEGDAIRRFIDSEAPRTVLAFAGQPGGLAGDREAFDAGGIVPGEEYRYYIATAHTAEPPVIDPQDPDPEVEERMSPLSAPSPQATAIAPPVVVSPIDGQQVLLSAIPVTWQQTPGADTYFIWVSTDPRFPENQRVQFGPFVRPRVEVPQPTTEVIDARNARFAGSEQLFISVGGRNSQDRIPPRPFGAIFSQPVRVEPEDTPPPPPGDGTPPPGDGPPPPPQSAGAGRTGALGGIKPGQPGRTAPVVGPRDGVRPGAPSGGPAGVRGLGGRK